MKARKILFAALTAVMVSTPAHAYTEMMGGPLTSTSALQRHLTSGLKKCGLSEGAIILGISHATRSSFTEAEAAKLDETVEQELENFYHAMGTQRPKETKSLEDHIRWMLASSSHISLGIRDNKPDTEKPDDNANLLFPNFRIAYGCVVDHFFAIGFMPKTRGCSTCEYNHWKRQQDSDD